MSINTILLKTFSKVYIPSYNFDDSSNISNLKWSFIHELNANGYMPSDKLFSVLDKISFYDLIELHKDFIESEKVLNPCYNVFYPNFPNQVLEMDEFELYSNAIIHYLTNGNWTPMYEKKVRQFKVEPNQTFDTIDVITSFDYLIELFHSVLYSKDSITAKQQEFIEYILDDCDFPYDIDKIVHKEILAIVNGINIKYNLKVKIDNATDVLRAATYLSDGDVSLSTNTKFKSFKRSIRRKLIIELDSIINEEDIQRHRNKWIKLFHSLHVGEYKFAITTNTIASKIRESVKLETFNAKVEKYIKEKNTVVFNILKTRPTEFARRLNELFIVFDLYRYEIISEFSKVIKDVPTKVLIQLYGYFENYGKNEYRVMFPKSINKAIYVYENNTFDHSITICNIKYLIENTLKFRFSNNSELKGKKIYISDELMNIPVPSGMRTISDGKFTLPRGSKLDITNDNTLRFFLHWIGKDLDLSAICFDKDFNELDEANITYYNLKNTETGCCHSGDIVNAPKPGCEEYLDIDINKSLKYGIRYVLMSVYVYNDLPFDKLEECYCGWMSRSYPDSNEIFDVKTVKQKVDLVADSTQYYPALFDLKERKIIWTDLYNTHSKVLGTNVANSTNSIGYVLKAINNVNKMSLYKLFCLHSVQNGVLVDNKEEADVVFDMNFDINEINTKYI